MTWIGFPPEGRASLGRRLLLALLGRKARASESIRLWSMAPGAFVWFQGLHRALDRRGSPLDPALRSLVMLRVSQRNGCVSCVDRNATRASGRGVPEAKVTALDLHASSPLFDARERAALAFADAVTARRPGVDPGLREALRAAFPPEAIVELAALVAFQGMSSAFNAALDAAPDGACALPAGPAPSAAPALPEAEDP